MHPTRVRFCMPIVLVLTFMTGASAAMLLMQSNDPKATRLQQLLNEKLTTLETIVAQMEKLHTLRAVSLKELYAARVSLLRAKLDLCTSDQTRIDVLEEILTEAKRREATFRDLPKTGIKGVPEEATELRGEEAKVDRLDVEIEIERLKSKQ